MRQNVSVCELLQLWSLHQLESDSACPYCHAPISMLDMKQPQRMLEQLKHAAEPKPVDPALALKLASVKSSLEVSLADERSPNGGATPAPSAWSEPAERPRPLAQRQAG